MLLIILDILTEVCLLLTYVLPSLGTITVSLLFICLLMIPGGLFSYWYSPYGKQPIKAVWLVTSVILVVLVILSTANMISLPSGAVAVFMAVIGILAVTGGYDEKKNTPKRKRKKS